ncbi:MULTISPECIES: adenosylcobinamide-phosphate synthase CbiB [Bradyrhizobium]|nr:MULTISPECIES: adenosylcobinamide-phosphate synthase CbiB [Bradyrhizobium]
MSGASIMLLALAIDAVLGWPPAIHARIGHPVTWIGALISVLDRSFNREDASETTRRMAGIGVAIAVIAVVAGGAWVCASMLPGGWPGLILAAILAWPLVAARSMHDHVDAVARPLLAGDLPAARQAVAMIVGRDPSQLDAAGIARAATESLAENTSDGIVAPLFWGAIFGLPGIAAYKAINTLDSMIGHRTPRHEAFGWAAARIDDVANLIPARLTGVLFAIVSVRPRVALATMWRDAGHHRSPNAGWPEAAMAGALRIRLSGPRIYEGRLSQEPWLNAEAPDPSAADLNRALALYRRAMFVLAAGLALLAVL